MIGLLLRKDRLTVEMENRKKRGGGEVGGWYEAQTQPRFEISLSFISCAWTSFYYDWPCSIACNVSKCLICQAPD